MRVYFAYYVVALFKLTVTSNIEEALRKQIRSGNVDYLRRENLNDYAYVYAVVDLYRATVLKGYHYTISYLESVGKDASDVINTLTVNTKAFEQYEQEIVNEYNRLYNA